MSVMNEISPELQQWWTVICGWHEFEIHHVHSDDPKTAMFKAQCRSWKSSYEHDPQSMAGVNPDHVIVVAVFLGKIENLYPFMEPV